MKILQTTATRLPGILLLALLATGCTFTTTLSKPPEFKESVDSLERKIDSLATYEHINFAGAAKTINGKTSSELEIDIINGKDLPSDENKLTTLGASIASRFRKDLKNPDDYNTFKVLFVTLEKKGSVTTRNYKGFIYKSKDL